MSKKSIQKVLDTVSKYSEDYRLRIKELNNLVRDGQRTGDALKVGAAYYYISVAYNDLGDRDETLKNALKAEALLKYSNEYELLAKVYIVLGVVYGDLGDTKLEFENNEKAFKIVKKHRIKGFTKLTAMNDLSSSYHMLGDVKTSIQLLSECVELVKVEYPDENEDLAMYLINLANCYKDYGKPEKSREILGSMESWIEEIKFVPMICDYYLRFAIASYESNGKKEGDKYVDKAFKLTPKDTYPLPICDDISQVAVFFAKNGDKKRAKIVFDFMTAMLENNKGTLEQIFAYRTMANYYKCCDEHEKASEYFEKLSDVLDKRTEELMTAQLNLQITMKETDVELGKLTRKMEKSKELLDLEPMTKLLNRAALLKVSSEFIESALKKKQKVGAVFIDIDYFKECNDTYGHAKGDEIIRTLARICKSQETPNVRFARYGGDEFFGLAKGLTDEEVADIAVKICKCIKDENIPNKNNPNGHIITLSIGVVNVTITSKTDTIIEIANYADKALYHAKNTGKNSIYYLNHGSDVFRNNTSYVKVDF